MCSSARFEALDSFCNPDVHVVTICFDNASLGWLVGAASSDDGRWAGLCVLCGSARAIGVSGMVGRYVFVMLLTRDVGLRWCVSLLIVVVSRSLSCCCSFIVVFSSCVLSNMVCWTTYFRNHT